MTFRRTAVHHCRGCHRDADEGYGSWAPEDWCCAILHEEGRKVRWLGRDEVCDECETKSSEERRYAREQAVRAMERFKGAIGTYELCGTCGTFLGVQLYVGSWYVAPFETDDFWDWQKAGYPHLHVSRSTRVPVKGPLPSLNVGAQPDASSPPLNIREVPHEWRTW